MRVPKKLGWLRSALIGGSLLGCLVGCKGLSEMNQNQRPVFTARVIDGKQYFTDWADNKSFKDSLDIEVHKLEDISILTTVATFWTCEKQDFPNGYIPIQDTPNKFRFHFSVQNKGKYSEMLSKVKETYNTQVNGGIFNLSELPSVKALSNFPIMVINGVKYILLEAKPQEKKLDFYLIEKDSTSIEINEEFITLKNSAGRVYRPVHKDFLSGAYSEQGELIEIGRHLKIVTEESTITTEDGNIIHQILEKTIDYECGVE